MSAGKNARLTALKALLRVEEGKGYSNLVLDHGLAASGLDGRRRLCLGAVLRCAGAADHPGLSDFPLLKNAAVPDGGAGEKRFKAGLTSFFIWIRFPKRRPVNESAQADAGGEKDKAPALSTGILRSFIRDGCPCLNCQRRRRMTT